MPGRQPQRGRAQRAGGKQQIYLRPERTEERHQWTVAHEIGEHLKPPLMDRLALEPAEVKCQRYVHYYSRAKRIQEDGWTVHGWPVHQTDWKREILRSVVDEG